MMGMDDALHGAWLHGCMVHGCMVHGCMVWMEMSYAGMVMDVVSKKGRGHLSSKTKREGHLSVEGHLSSGTYLTPVRNRNCATI